MIKGEQDPATRILQAGRCSRPNPAAAAPDRSQKKRDRPMHKAAIRAGSGDHRADGISVEDTFRASTLWSIPNNHAVPAGSLSVLAERNIQ